MIELALINRHWREGYSYPFLIKRDLYSTLLSAVISKKSIISLIGLRRTGKTTLLKQLINQLIESGKPRTNILFYSFDEGGELQEVLDIYLKVALKNLGEDSLIFFLDEIQKLPNWQNKIKIYYDHYPNLKFVVSGSSSVFLRKKSESLAGRIREFWLPPLSFPEFLRFRGKGELMATPNLFAAELQQELELFASRQFIETISETDDFIENYLSTLVRKIVFEDIPQVYPVEQPQVLLKIFQIIASNPGMLLDYHNLSSDLKINEKTLSNYVHYLEMAFLIKKLYNYSPNMLTSEKKLKKVYPLSSAFCKVELSKVMECLAATQLPCRFFWRKTHEVDCILEEAGKLLPIEVKYALKINEKELKGLLKFMREFSVSQGVVLTKSKEDIVDNIRYAPIWKYLLSS